MSDNERKYGREGAAAQPAPAAAPVSPEPVAPAATSGLSEADKQRIREEEEYRAQIRAELGGSEKPKAQAAKKAAKAAPKPSMTPEEREAKLQKERERQKAEAADPTLPKRKPSTSVEDNLIYDQVRRENLSPEERAKEDRKNGIGCGFFGLILLIAFGLMAKSCAGDMSERRAAAEAREAASRTLAGQDSTTIEVACEEHVRNKLKSPASAEFPEVGNPAFVNEKWVYAGEVDSQNSFGAMIRSRYICEVSGTTKEDAVIQTTILD